MDHLVVARTSSSVRSIDALIDGKQKHECILDPGSQVIAMSEAICHEVGLPYDPTLRIRLISANGTFDYSLGLARNIPFQVGTITIYLQVHIIREPSYGILLGRPFDIITQSVVRNFANADQTITVFDPNTGRRATIPTFARTKECNHDQDF
jgi:Aspartyl protease